MSFLINPFIHGGAGGGGSPELTFDPESDILSDTINLDAGIVEFLYAGAGENPGGGAYVDEITLDVGIVDFSYTT